MCGAATERLAESRRRVLFYDERLKNLPARVYYAVYIVHSIAPPPNATPSRAARPRAAGTIAHKLWLELHSLSISHTLGKRRGSRHHSKQRLYVTHRRVEIFFPI